MAAASTPSPEGADKPRHDAAINPNGLYSHDGVPQKPAHEIPVNAARLIFIWPLVTKFAEDGRNHATQARQTRQQMIDQLLSFRKIGAPKEPAWFEIEDLLDHAEGTSRLRQTQKRGARCHGLSQEEVSARASSYAEFVYFHDFLHDSLYRGAPGADQDPNDAALRILRRADIARMHYSLSKPDPLDDTLTYVHRVDAVVERCNLYLFRTGVVLLVTEINIENTEVVTELRREKTQTTTKETHRVRPPSALTLATLQTLMDQVRRTFPPYFDPGRRLSDNSPGGMPYHLSFVDEEGHEIALGSALSGEPDPLKPNAMSFLEAEAMVRTRDGAARVAPAAAQWRALLEPLHLDGYEAAAPPKGHPPLPPLRHVVDERIPMMSFISLTGASGASDDVDRRDLWTVKRGDWIRLSYADPPGASPLPYASDFLKAFEADTCYDRFFPDTQGFSASRMMFAGYHTCFVGAGWFFDNRLAGHFRRHYFQMGLLLTLEFASLLSLSSRISTLVARAQNPLPQSRKPRAQSLADSIVEVQRDFLTYVHLYRFTGISNQIQPTEMYDKWRGALRLERLFVDVKDELKSSTDFLMAERQVRQTDSANKLALFAAFGVIIAFAATLLGMNFVFQPAFWSLGLDPAASGLGGASGSGTASEALAADHKRIMIGQISIVFAVLAGSGLLFLAFLVSLNLMGFGRAKEPPITTLVRNLCLGLVGLSLIIAVLLWHWQGQLG